MITRDIVAVTVAVYDYNASARTGTRVPGKHINFPADAGYPLIIKMVKSIGLLVLLG